MKIRCLLILNRENEICRGREVNEERILLMARTCLEKTSRTLLTTYEFIKEGTVVTGIRKCQSCFCFAFLQRWLLTYVREVNDCQESSVTHFWQPALWVVVFSLFPQQAYCPKPPQALRIWACRADKMNLVVSLPHRMLLNMYLYINHEKIL